MFKKRELKSKKFTLSMTPTDFGLMEKISYVENCSVNHAINLAISEYIKANKSKLEEYDKLYGEEQEENLWKIKLA